MIYHVGPLIYETGPQLNISSRVQVFGCPAFRRALTVDLPHSKHCVNPHNAPPQYELGAMWSTYDYLNTISLDCQGSDGVTEGLGSIKTFLFIYFLTL